MADYDLLGDGLRKVLLAGIGALATGYEKSSELVDELVKKGEITVEQGKALNTELKRKVSETVDDAKKAAAEAGDKAAAAADTSAADKPADGFFFVMQTGFNGFRKNIQTSFHDLPYSRF